MFPHGQGEQSLMLNMNIKDLNSKTNLREPNTAWKEGFEMPSSIFLNVHFLDICVYLCVYA